MREVETLDPPADVAAFDRRTTLLWCPGCELGVRVWRTTRDRVRMRRGTRVFAVLVALGFLALVIWILVELSRMKGIWLVRDGTRPPAAPGSERVPGVHPLARTART